MASPNARYFTKGARYAERAAWIMTAAGVIVMLAGVAALPEEVPTHWGSTAARRLGVSRDLPAASGHTGVLQRGHEPCRAPPRSRNVEPSRSSARGRTSLGGGRRACRLRQGCEAVLGGWLLVDSLLTVLQLSELMLPSVLALLAALAAVIAVPLVRWRRYVQGGGSRT